MNNEALGEPFQDFGSVVFYIANFSKQIMMKLSFFFLALGYWRWTGWVWEFADVQLLDVEMKLPHLEINSAQNVQPSKQPVKQKTKAQKDEEELAALMQLAWHSIISYWKKKIDLETPFLKFRSVSYPSPNQTNQFDVQYKRRKKQPPPTNPTWSEFLCIKPSHLEKCGWRSLNWILFCFWVSLFRIYPRFTR